jgi:hypothetical protein
MHRHAGTPPDLDGLASGVEQADTIRGFVALMSVVDAAA